MQEKHTPLLKVISSGSLGNSYIIEVGDERLLLDCGVKWSMIVKSLGYSLVGVEGVLCTHR